MLDIKIKELGLEDLDDFFSLFSSMIQTQFPEYTPRTREAFLKDERLWSKIMYKKSLRNKSRFILGAYLGKRLVGIFDSINLLGGVWLGIWLMVEPSYQRKGIGRLLLQEWEKRMEKAGIHSLQIYSDKRNVPYYKKMGFTLVGLCKKSWFGTDDYLFTKQIQEPIEENYLR